MLHFYFSEIEKNIGEPCKYVYRNKCQWLDKIIS
jgi:hypothetical protein